MYPSHTKMDTKNDAEAHYTSINEAMRTNTEYMGAAYGIPRYTVTHRKTWVERLEDLEQQNFGTRVISTIYDNFVAGWRAGLNRSFMFSLAALIVNACVFLWLFFTFDRVRGVGLITISRCGKVYRLETGIKAGLNVISTLILGASTYAMQGTTAPTREEVDKAHKKGKWLEIGTQSWRNLSYVSRRHVAIWGVLASTSLPLHLV